MQPPVVFLSNFAEQRLDADATKYKFVGSGGIGCVFKGPVDGIVRIIKINREYGIEALRRSMHEVIIGNMVHAKMNPAGASHWVQTVGYALHTGAINVLANAVGIDKKCKSALKKNVTHMIIVQDVAGEQDLASYIETHRRLTDRTIRSIAFQLNWALYTASALYGFVHSDIKPQNIMVTETKVRTTLRYIVKTHSTLDQGDVFEIDLPAGAPIVRLIDLGGSYTRIKEAEPPADLPVESPLCKDAIETYTAIFKSPDVSKTVASDLFALGITLVTMICNGAKNFQVNGYDYDYKLFGQPPVAGLTNQGNRDYVNNKAINRNEIMQMVVLANAVGVTVPAGALMEELKKAEQAGVDLMPGMLKVIQDATGGEKEGLLFIQDLMQLVSDDRLKFGTKAKFGPGNALMHPYFNDYYKGNLDVTYLIADPATSHFVQGHLVPLMFKPTQIGAQIDSLYKYYDAHTEAALESTLDHLSLTGPGSPYHAIAPVLKQLLIQFTNSLQQQTAITVDLLQQYAEWMHAFAELMDTNPKLQAAMRATAPSEATWLDITKHLVRESFIIKGKRKRIIKAATLNNRTIEQGGYQLESSLAIEPVYRILMPHVEFMFVTYQITTQQPPTSNMWNISGRTTLAEYKQMLVDGKTILEHNGVAKWIEKQWSIIEKQLKQT
jgi:serine/threonine protein kinase